METSHGIFETCHVYMVLKLSGCERGATSWMTDITITNFPIVPRPVWHTFYVALQRLWYVYRIMSALEHPWHTITSRHKLGTDW